MASCPIPLPERWNLIGSGGQQLPHSSLHRNLCVAVSSGCLGTISNSSPETRGASPPSLSDTLLPLYGSCCPNSENRPITGSRL